MKKLIILLTAVALGQVKVPLNLQTFNSGELSPLMNSRSDYPKYPGGAKTLQNMLVRSQGPVSRRPGTKYIAAVKDADDATRLISFEYSTTDAYIIELGDEYARFYRSGGQIQFEGSPYEIVTPWDESDVFELQFAQDAETMRIIHPDYEPYKLTRTAHTSWTLVAIDSTTGPFNDENTDTSWTITPSAVTGDDIDLASTDNLFQSGHVGGLFQISHILSADSISHQFWSHTAPDGTEESDSITVQKYRYYDAMTSGSWRGTFKVQRSYDAGVTWEDVYSVTYRYNGNIQYTGQELQETCLYRMQMVGQYVTGHNFRHFEGICQANFNARIFQNNGTVEITAVTDANNAVAEVKIDLGSTDATWHWSEGAWSDYRGWPRAIVLHEQRMVYGGSSSYPQTIWSSIIATSDDEYDDFTANTLSDASGNLGGPDDIAWRYILPGMNPIQWLYSGNYLFVGTTNGVGRLGQPDKPITPNFTPTYRTQNHNGCAYLQPVGAVDAILYIERGGQKVRELLYTYTTDKYEAPDMTVLSEHITGEGVLEIDFQKRPEPVLWCIREDGQLLSFTYNKAHAVLAWSHSDTGASGEFASVAIIPASDEDEVWTIVDRTINSTDVKYVEQMQSWDWGTDQNDMWFVDSGGTDCNDLSWLEGEEVTVLADSKPIGEYTVSGSAITASGYTDYVIGLPYTSVYESMPIVTRQSGISSALMKTSILQVKLDLQDTLACNLGRDADNKSAIQFSKDNFATTVESYTGLKVATFPRGLSRDMTIYVDVNEPVPMTLRSINPVVQIYE